MEAVDYRVVTRKILLNVLDLAGATCIDKAVQGW